jgi:hypothetical protein
MFQRVSGKNASFRQLLHHRRHKTGGHITCVDAAWSESNGEQTPRYRGVAPRVGAGTNITEWPLFAGQRVVTMSVNGRLSPLESAPGE